jgi:RNA polymerase sigma-70 factor (ECF subfamily)
LISGTTGRIQVRSNGCRVATERLAELSAGQRVYLSGERTGRDAKGFARMGNKSSDQALVERVQAGDKSAFDVLVARYQHKVIKLVMRYVRDQADALDVSQEAFLKAYRALPRFRGDSAFYTWLYRISINTAKNYLVAARRRPLEYDLDLQDPEQYDLHGRLKDIDTPEAEVLTEEIREAVNQAIEALPEDLRTAIMLRELEGMSYEDIATTMECPVGTVRSRIFRAREAIDKRLRPLLQ